MTLSKAVAGLVLAGVTLTACGGSDSPTGPTDPPVTIGPTVLSVSPATGPAAGGTEVTIGGANFAAGATVTIGGVAATNVQFVTSASLKATTAARAAGPADVTVTVDGRSSTLTGGFTYVLLPPPTISGISPASGSTAGGTTVTVSGTNFAAGASLTIGGVAATGVTVLSATSLRAVTGARAAGASDVVVAVGAQSATLARGFTYVVPGPNLPPAIASLKVQSTQPNAPPDFADLNEDVPVTAVVTDDQTPVSELVYEWSATLGTITGTGASVRWRAPAAAATPVAVTLTLKVSEPPAGGAGSLSSTARSTIALHDSVREIRDLSYQFLLDFSQQALSPEQIVRNFYTGCPGRADELTDVANNQKNFKINSYSVFASFPVAINFSGRCPFRNKAGDGCAQVPVDWKSTCLTSDTSVCIKDRTYTSTGTDQLTAVYRQNRWWLCDSDFDGSSTSPVLPGFIR